MKSRREIAQMIKGLKNVPCMDCVAAGRDGIWPPECMDFDHRPEHTKIGSVASLWDNEELLLAEIAKCDVVCASCHRIRTVVRGKSDKHRKALSNSAKKRWARGNHPMTSVESQERRIAASRLAPKRPEVRAKNSAALRKVLRDPIVRAKRSASQRKRFGLKRIHEMQKIFDRKVWYTLVVTDVE